MPNLKSLPVILFLLATCGLTVAAETTSKEPTTLDLSGKNVKRQEVNQSLIGYASTTLFYTLQDQHIIVALNIDNTKKEFPVSGNVYLFATDVTADAMGKWLNNQHSDAIFPGVPEPTATVNLPAEACKTIESKLVGKTTANNGVYNQHQVGIKISEAKVNEQFKIKEFKDTANVYVEAK